MIVTIKIGYDSYDIHMETHLLMWDGDQCCFEWDSDWWEGQKNVELVGYVPLHKLRIYGTFNVISTEG